MSRIERTTPIFFIELDKNLFFFKIEIGMYVQIIILINNVTKLKMFMSHVICFMDNA
jgi:hypothetical protein